MTVILVAGAATVLWTAVGLYCHHLTNNGELR